MSAARCPKPDKVAYLTQLAAENARLRINASNGTPQRLSRAYECRCGYWHLTKWGYVAGRQRSRAPRHLYVAPETLAAPPVPEPAPASWAPSDPISAQREAHWDRMKGEAIRDHLSHPWPWPRRSEAA